MRRALRHRIVGAVVEQGVTSALPDPLKKRIRLTNALSLFGAFVMLASIPFDRSHAPRWMLGEDVAGAAAYLLFPLLNRTRHLLLSRVLCIVVSNLIGDEPKGSWIGAAVEFVYREQSGRKQHAVRLAPGGGDPPAR